LKEILGQQEPIESRQRLFSRLFFEKHQKSRKTPLKKRKNLPQFLVYIMITESSISAVQPGFGLQSHQIKKNIWTQLKKDGKSAINSHHNCWKVQKRASSGLKID
jgi:hypothetical protein